jgi:hypothetical protein
MAKLKECIVGAVCPQSYEIRHLTEAQIGQAFPLVREFGDTFSLAEWQQYAKRFLDSGRGLRRESGILVVHGPASIYLRGLCVYRLFPDIVGGDRLITGCFAVPATIDCHAVARELVTACAAIAEAHGCHWVHVHLCERNRWIETVMHDAGYANDRSSFLYAVPSYRHH